MIVTDTMMAPGSFECELRTDSRFLKEIGPVGFLVVFDRGVKVPSLAAARYVGRVLKVEGSTVSGEGLESLLAQSNGLGVVATAPLTRSAQSLSAWFADLFPVNGVTVDFVDNTGLTAWAGTWQVGQSLREFLADLMRGVGGAEWSISTDGKISAFKAIDPKPRVLVTPNAETSLGSPRGVDGYAVGVVRSAESLASRVLVAGEGEGAEMVTAVQSTGVTIQGLDGLALEMTAVVDAPQQDATGAATVALLQAGLRGAVRETFDVEVTDPDVRRYVAKGETVAVFHRDAGVFDMSNPVPFGGKTVYPVTVRVHTVSGPFPADSSVWWFTKGSVWQDLTPDVVWGNSTTLLRVGTGLGPTDWVDGGGSGAWLGDDEVSPSPRPWTIEDTKEAAGRSVADNYAAGRGTVADNRAARAAR